MKRACVFVLLLVLPSVIWAANSAAPLIAVGDGSVITRAKIPPVAAESKTQAEPPAAATTTPPTQEAAPATQAEPPSKLWPRDAAAIFITSCSHLRPPAVPPCTCIINELMGTMAHDEFMRLNDARLIESDSRYLAIRERCVPKTQQPAR